MSKRIYVAGASSNIEAIERYIQRLKEQKASSTHMDWVISFDWTAPVRAAGEASPDDPKVRREAALADLEGVNTADVVWLVQPEATSTSTGAWVELGAAITRRDFYRMNRDGNIKDVVVIASGLSKKCIFTDLVDYRFQNDEDAFEFITRILSMIPGSGLTSLSAK